LKVADDLKPISNQREMRGRRPAAVAAETHRKIKKKLQQECLTLRKAAGGPDASSGEEEGRGG